MKFPTSSSIPFFLPLLLVLLIACRLGNLNLPFFWDEAWSYANAVFNMHDHGLALLPGNANVDLTRGHPLVFYFLAAAWTKLFGTGLVAVHLFPLLISCLLITAVFYITNEFFGRITAMAATLLFALQSIFLAQSTMLLPEMMLTLWILLTLFFYSRKKWALFMAFSILLVMTKETGMVLIGALFFDKIILERFFTRAPKASPYLRIKETAILSIPILVFAAFITLQKFKFGWFFFPEHTDLLVLNFSEIKKAFWIYLSKLFFQNGRNIFFIVSVGSFAYLIYKKSISVKYAHFLSFSIVFILFYLTFCAVNFFTPRYLLSMLPFFIMPGSWLIISLPVKKWLSTSILSTLALLFAYQTFLGNQKEIDTSLAYKNTVLIQKEAVHFIEDSIAHDQSLYSFYLIQFYMAEPRLGYLRKGPASLYEFKSISNADVLIFCSNEKDPCYENFSVNKSCILLKRFQKKQAWVEIYQRKNPTSALRLCEKY